MPQPIPELAEIAKIGAGAGVIAYGIVQGGKLAAASVEQRIGSVLWNLAVRSCSVGAGAGVGYLLERSSWGLVAGACGGVLASSIVLVIKRAISAWQPSGGGAPPASGDDA